jgi:hypothetical protein
VNVQVSSYFEYKVTKTQKTFIFGRPTITKVEIFEEGEEQ